MFVVKMARQAEGTKTVSIEPSACSDQLQIKSGFVKPSAWHRIDSSALSRSLHIVSGLFEEKTFFHKSSFSQKSIFQDSFGQKFHLIVNLNQKPTAASFIFAFELQFPDVH